MDNNQTIYELTDYALELIHHKAVQLLGSAGFTEDDVEDIRQDLILDLLERLPKFNSAKASYNTFVDRVVGRKMCTLIRHRQMELRDYRREEGSIHDMVEASEDGMVERITGMSQDEQDLRSGKYLRSTQERDDLRLDIEAILVGEPPELRRAAELLMSYTPAQAARKMRVPRSSFYDKHLARLRELFAEKGMGEYFFHNSPTHFDCAG